MRERSAPVTTLTRLTVMSCAMVGSYSMPFQDILKTLGVTLRPLKGNSLPILLKVHFIALDCKFL
jgi:hypothetical protein